MSDTKLLAKDLRIGNLHYYRMADDFDDRKEWTEISIIDANDILFLSENPDDENYSPIPLSEDVLVKFGFKKDDTEWKLFPCFDVQIIIYVDGICCGVMFYTRTIHTDYVPIYCNKTISFAHQLQNLFHSLTGEELIYTEN